MTNVNETNTTEAIKYDDKVLKKIVGTAVSEVQGVLGPSGGMLDTITDKVQTKDDVNVEKGIHVKQKDNELEVKIKLIVEMGRNIPEITQQVRDKVETAVENQTDLTVSSIEVDVSDSMSRADYENKFRTPKDEA